MHSLLSLNLVLEVKTEDNIMLNMANPDIEAKMARIIEN